MSLPQSVTVSTPAATLGKLFHCNGNDNRVEKFVANTRKFFSNLWHYKLDLGLGLLSIAGGFIIICLVDLPTLFGSEEFTNGLPFIMIGAGGIMILNAFRRAYVDTLACFDPTGLDMSDESDDESDVESDVETADQIQQRAPDNIDILKQFELVDE